MKKIIIRFVLSGLIYLLAYWVLSYGTNGGELFEYPEFWWVLGAFLVIDIGRFFIEEFWSYEE